MDYLDVARAAFLDELEKISASSQMMRGSQSRSGRRPMRVSTLLRKEKEGTLYKHSADLAAGPLPTAPGTPMGTPAVKPRKPGEVPTRDDMLDNMVYKGDGRDNAQVVYSPSFNQANISGVL